MEIDQDDFKTLNARGSRGYSEAAERLCRDYQMQILRVVRRTLPRRMRVRFDSGDFVNDVWLSFFAHPPTDGRFEDSRDFVAYLARMARNKVGEVRRRTVSERPTSDGKRPWKPRPRQPRSGHYLRPTPPRAR